MLNELDGAIRAAAAAGLDWRGIVAESRIEARLVQHVVAGGSSIDYLLLKRAQHS
ncbi:hypothetical protein JOE59_001299 [Agromyces cerinus]|uniref:hypothetical protein n=1 Tax=Agromyces cerinus TaxID=33878 RepID=UPI0019572AA1|nr:hypothetical protein [Agromyces cerinus]MBM7830594.1 hypothetical protein [Agromyces cerinus]